MSFEIINKTVFHNTTPDLQDQDHSVQDQDRFFLSETGLVLRPTVSDHITAISYTETLVTNHHDQRR